MIIFVFIRKRYFQLITFMYETKLKGHDGIAVYKSLHFSPGFTGSFPEVGETHVDGGCHWRFFCEIINGSFMFVVEIFHDDFFLSICCISFIPDDGLRISRNA